MPEWLPWPILAVILGAFAVAAAVMAFQRRRERQRAEEMIAWAAMLGFTITIGSKPLREAGLSEELTGLPLFTHGRAPRVRNVVRGRTPEGELLLFDFRYTVQSGKHTTTIEQTVVAFERPAALPAFELRPEGVFARIGQAFGATDIDFDSNPEFSKKYQLRGQDPDAVRRLFEREAVPCLAQTSGWSVEGARHWLIVFRHGRRQAVEGLTAHVESVRTIARTIAAR